MFTTFTLGGDKYTGSKQLMSDRCSSF